MSHKMHIENIDASLDGIDEMVAHIRRLSDAGGKMADELTNNMNSMSRSDTFDAAMDVWRQFTKMGAAITWLELHARTARRNTNSLLDMIPEGAGE
jgi:hypothetical protein